MSTLAVIAYPNQNTAGEAAAALQRMQKEFLIELEDVAWVTKSQDGKMKLHQGANLTGAGAAERCHVGLPLRFALPRPPLRHGPGRGHRRPGRQAQRLRHRRQVDQRGGRPRSNRADRGSS